MKKIITVLLLVMFTLIACSSPNNNDMTNESIPMVEEEKDSKVNTASNQYLTYLENMFSGGVAKDGIPAIDNPVYTNVAGAEEYLNESDQVFVYQTPKQIYVYPQRILVWHEIVNDKIDDLALSITYCPLTGSAICYLSPDGETSLGVSGSLINSNLVMYDRSSDALWPQLLGFSITGEQAGMQLESRPIHWMTWGQAKLHYPDLKVLTTETGAFRDYNRDPYGSYTQDGANNYYVNDQVYFETMHSDNRFHQKKSIIALIDGNNSYAINIKNFPPNGYASLSNDDYLVVMDPATSLVYIYENSNLNVANGVITNGISSWYFNGQGIDTEESLTSPVYFDVFWFAFIAYYPDAQVVTIDD